MKNSTKIEPIDLIKILIKISMILPPENPLLWLIANRFIKIRMMGQKVGLLIMAERGTPAISVKKILIRTDTSRIRVGSGTVMPERGGRKTDLSIVRTSTHPRSPSIWSLF